MHTCFDTDLYYSMSQEALYTIVNQTYKGFGDREKDGKRDR